ncbi:MAG: RNA ligase [Paracoccaceae bacterium]
MEIVIETLGDVLPHIEPDTGIIHSDHGAYSVINYVYTLDHTFDSAFARECRGLKFDAEGRLIARPFHKFFNLGERQAAQEEPWDRPHLILDKLDGSMVHPAMVGGELTLMTRMGVSAQSRQALAMAGHAERALCVDMMAAGYTPVFEFTAPDNRIVVAYDQARLTLLAIRHMRTGAYMPHDEVAAVAARHGVALIGSHGSVADANTFWKGTRALPDIEGYVIAFDDGHRLKIKTDAFVLRHKALSGLAHEKNVLAWVAADAVDDVLPLLNSDAADQVKAYRDQVLLGLARLSDTVQAVVQEHGALPRKEFAQRVQTSFDPRLRAAAFRALDGTPPRVTLTELLRRSAASSSKIEALRPLIGMTWDALEVPE